MTNNEIYERLTALYEKLGVVIEDGTKEKGELLAYCVAIDLIKNNLEENFVQIFPETSYGIGLSLFCELLGIDGSLDSDSKKKLIKQGLSQHYGDYIYETFKKEIENLPEAFFIEAKDFHIILEGTVKDDYTILPKLGKIFENYLPPCTVAEFDGDGIDFDYWDSTPYLFEDYDNLNLSFHFLDTLY